MSLQQSEGGTAAFLWRREVAVDDHVYWPLLPMSAIAAWISLRKKKARWTDSEPV